MKLGRGSATGAAERKVAAELWLNLPLRGAANPHVPRIPAVSAVAQSDDVFIGKAVKDVVALGPAESKRGQGEGWRERFPLHSCTRKFGADRSIAACPKSSLSIWTLRAKAEGGYEVAPSRAC
jgi:hypothetical protein